MLLFTETQEKCLIAPTERIRIQKHVFQSTCQRATCQRVSYKTPQPAQLSVDPTAPMHFTLPPPSARSRPAHTCICVSLMPNWYFPIYCHLPSLSADLALPVSLCSYGLPVAMISVIRVYVLIGVNTKMGVAENHFCIAAINCNSDKCGLKWWGDSKKWC